LLDLLSQLSNFLFESPNEKFRHIYQSISRQVVVEPLPARPGQAGPDLDL